MRTRQINRILAMVLMFAMIFTSISTSLISFADTKTEEVSKSETVEEVNYSANETAELTKNKTDLAANEVAFSTEYIARHYDKNYITKVMTDAITKPVTYVRSSAVFTYKGDEISKDNIISAMDYNNLLYDVDPDSDWYVMLPNSKLGVMDPADISVIYNNDRAEMIKDSYYDKNNSILYIKKDVVDNPKNKYELFDNKAPIAVQAEYKLSEKYHDDGTPDYSTKVPVVAINNGNKAEYQYSNIDVHNMFDTSMIIPCIVNDPSLYDKSDFIILTNGSLIAASEDDYAYDNETGEILLNESAATVSSVTVLINQKGIMDKVKDVISDLFIEKAHAIAFSDMVFYKNPKGKMVYLSSGGNLYNDIFVGWRGYYDPATSNITGTGTAAKATTYYGYASNVLKLNGAKDSTKYLYYGKTKNATWGIASYAKGTDITKKGGNGNYTDKDKKVSFPSSLSSGEFTSKDKKTPYDWFQEYRNNLLRYYNSGTGYATNFAFKFPNKIENAKILRTEGSMKNPAGGININTDQIAEASGNIWLAGYCAHYAKDAGDNSEDKNSKQKGYHGDKVCVTCLSRGMDGKTPYVVLAFVGDSTYYVSKNEHQTGIAIYKFAVEVSTPPVTITKKYYSGTAPSWWTDTPDLTGAEFKVYKSASDASTDKNSVASFTTNASGKTTEAKIDPGDYYVKETKVPGNDLNSFEYMDPNPKKITVKNDTGSTQNFNVVDWPKTPKAVLDIKKYKQTEDGRETETATFDIWPKKYGTYAEVHADHDDIWNTIDDEVKQKGIKVVNGEGESKELPCKSAVFNGEYYLHQTFGPDGVEWVQNEPITLDEDGTYLWEHEDPLPPFAVQKLDASNDEPLAQAGIQFKVKKQEAWDELLDLLDGIYLEKDAKKTAEESDLDFTPDNGSDISAETESTYNFVLDEEIPDGDIDVLFNITGNTEGNQTIICKKSTLKTEEIGTGVSFSYDGDKTFTITTDGTNPDAYSVTGIKMCEYKDPIPTQHDPLSEDEKKAAVDAFLSDDPVKALEDLGYSFEDAAWVSIGGKSLFTTNENGIAEVPEIEEEDFGDYGLYEVTPPEDYKIPNYKGAAIDPESFPSENDRPANFTLDTVGQTGYVTVKDVPYPYINTEALDKNTESHEGATVEDAGLIDNVTASKIVENMTYTIFGTLYDKDTGKPLLDKDDKEITASETFTSDDISEVVPVKFDFDKDVAAGKKVVVFERMYEGSFDEEPEDIKPIAVHEDINDAEQLVTYPKGWTEALDDDTESQLSVPSATASITDTFHYEGLDPEGEYTLKGVLMDKETGEPITNIRTEEGEGIDDESDPEEGTDDVEEEGIEMPVTAEGTFTPESSDGEFKLTFEFNSLKLGGRDIVVFESLEYNGKVILEHKDLEDEKQTIYFPGISTSAKDTSTDSHLGHIAEEITIRDTVTYKNLMPGKEYHVEGVLVDVDSGEELRFDEDGHLMGGKESSTDDEESGTDEEDTEEEIMDDEEAGGENLQEGNDDEEEDDGGGVDPGYGTLVESTSGPFTPDEKDGTVTLDFKLNSTELQGYKVVVYEKLYMGNTEIASHEDRTDEEQIIVFPEIATIATDKNTEEHIGSYGSSAEIIDVVKYNNLLPGMEYKVFGKLMDKQTNEPVFINGKEITAEETFTPESESGEITLKFGIDSTALEGHTLVAFERLYYNEDLIATHEDIDDEDQSVHEPWIRTHATDTATDDTHVGAYSDKDKIIDTVTYKNLIPGKKYTVRGILYDKKTGEPIIRRLYTDDTDTPENQPEDNVDTENIPEENPEGTTGDTDSEDGQGSEQKDNDGEMPWSSKYVTAESTFTAQRPDGQVQITFELDSRTLAGHTAVAFEELYFEDTLIAVHKDIEDEDQSIHYPEIDTNAVDKDTQLHIGSQNAESLILDRVTFTNLMPNHTYVITGKLYDKETNEPIMINGAAVEATSGEFTPTRPDGEVILKFNVDSSELEGKTLVAFEKMYYMNTVIATHEDIEDDDQSVHYPKIETEASDSRTEDNVLSYNGKAKVIDVVTYENLVPGHQYTVKGKLMNKETEEPVFEGSKEVASETTFVPDEPDGEVKVVFEFDSTDHVGETMVAFEELFYEETLIESHKDIDDDDQTVYQPKIRTHAKFPANKKQVSVEKGKNKNITVTDTVTYSNLVPGKKYTVEGRLMNKSTKSGTGIKTKRTFTASSRNGKIDIKFRFNTKRLKGNATYVAFEKLRHNDSVVAIHENINDKAQTVKIRTVTQTGDNMKYIYLGIIAVLALIAAGAVVVTRRKTK